MKTEEKKPEDKTREAPKVEIDLAVADATRAEVDRQDNITAIGVKYECADLAKKMIAERGSVDDMNKAVLDTIVERTKAAGPKTQLGLTSKETNQFSLLRAINACWSNDWSKAGFELECSRAIEDELDRAPEGFYIPYDVQSARSYKNQRVMTTGVDADGGFLVGTDHMGGSFIDLLTAQALLGRLNARFLPGLVGDVDIPRLDGGVAFNWVTEDADGTLDDATLGTLALAPKTITGQVPISRRLLKQSAPAVEQMLMNDMARGASLAIDLAGFEGSGAAGQPTGIVNTAGVGTSTIASAAAPTHVEIVEFETDVASANGLVGTLAYVETAPLRGTGKTTLLDAGSGRFLIEDNMQNGYPVEVSTQLTANTIVFGNFEDVVIGLWGVLDVYPDKAAKAAAGGLVLRVFQDVDLGLRHAGSFSINA